MQIADDFKDYVVYEDHNTLVALNKVINKNLDLSKNPNIGEILEKTMSCLSVSSMENHVFGNLKFEQKIKKLREQVNQENTIIANMVKPN